MTRKHVAGLDGSRDREGNWRPSVKQEIYLRVLFDAASNGRVLTHKELSALSGCGESTVCRWHRRPEFRAAVAGVLVDAQGYLVEAAHVASIQRSIRGSVRDYELLLRRKRELPDLLEGARAQADGQGGGLGWQVNIVNVPATPAPSAPDGVTVAVGAGAPVLEAGS